MKKQFTLHKKERLKSRKQIDLLFKQGKSFYVAPFKVFFLLEEKAEQPGLQLGVSVSKRNFKKAVDRNRIKRLIKEAWRLQKNEYKNTIEQTNVAVFVFAIYTSKEKMSFLEIKEKIAKVLDKLNQQASENGSLHT